MMTSVPQLNSGGLQNRTALSDTSTASSSSELYVNSYSSLDADLTIQTREGDVVTLSAAQHSELEAYEYSSKGVVANEDGHAAASYNVREITLSSGETFTFTVQGDLSEEELGDIESIISGVDGIIGEMMEGDLMGAVSQAMSIGYYDTISSYEADITVQTGYAAYSEEKTSATGALGQDLAAAYLGNSDNKELGDTSEKRTVGNLESPLTAQLTELLEQQQEDALARAREPLSSLFDHYLETREAAETSEKQAQTDESLGDKQNTGEQEETSFFDLIEIAAKTVDRTIADMMKNAFNNTFKSFI